MEQDEPIGTGIDRRTFVKAAAAVGLGAAVGCRPKGKPAEATTRPIAREMPPPVGPPKKYAIVGLGSRSQMYQNAIEKDYKAYAQLVGICDLNQGRMNLSNSESVANGAKAPPTYLATDFEKMLQDTKPDHVIVTTMCSTHSDYIVRTLNAGIDVITEKPLTTSAEKCQQIIDARAKTDKNIRVNFNYRYSPPRTQVKDILMSGEIGDILSVDFHWMLNTHHGADYFRRWHRNKRNSGGLMVHKATHHFDLVNWWLGAVPVQVMATGKREFYTPTMARRFGLEGPHERCLTCPEKDKCGFYFNLAGDENLKHLYMENEKYDGYFRDQCVWSDEIDIEDTMNVLVRYDNNITMAYSLNAFNAWEGYSIAFNGTKGRLEHTLVEQIYISGTNTVQGGIKGGGVKTVIHPIRGTARDVKPWTGTGGHGGGDTVMLDEIFLPTVPKDKYQRAADERAGAASILIGVAANRCFETGKPVLIADLVTGLNRPDYAPMPSRTGPVPMPQALPAPATKPAAKAKTKTV